MLKKHYKQAASFIDLIKYKIQKKKIPLFTALGITNRCNYQCVYCYGDYYNQQHENFSTEELLGFIDTLSEMGARIINLIGGEPLLRDDIDKLIKRVKDNGMICTVSSNVALLPEKIDKVKNVDNIDTSLDGVKENNDKNRGDGTFKKTYRGIQCAIDNGIKINVNMVLTKHNLNDIDPMVKLAADTGFTLSFNIAFESHSSKHKNYQNSFDIKSKDDALMKNALKKIIHYKTNGYPIRFSETAYRYALNWPLPYDENVYVSDAAKLKSFKPIKCYYSQFHCYIDTDGRMYNCMHVKDVAPIVNVKDIGIKKAWEKICAFRPPCAACYTICNNDANLIFGLKPATLISTMRDYLK